MSDTPVFKPKIMKDRLVTLSRFTFPTPSEFDPDKDKTPIFSKNNFSGVMLSRFLPRMSKEYIADFRELFSDENFVKKLKKFADSINETENDKVEMKRLATEIFGNFGHGSKMPEGKKDAIFYGVNLVEKLVFAKRFQDSDRVSSPHNEINSIISFVVEDQKKQLNENFLDDVIKPGIIRKGALASRIRNKIIHPDELAENQEIDPGLDLRLFSSGFSQTLYGHQSTAFSDDFNEYLNDLKHSVFSLRDKLTDIEIPDDIKNKIKASDVPGYQKIYAIMYLDRLRSEHITNEFPADGIEYKAFKFSDDDISSALNAASSIKGWRQSFDVSPRDVAWRHFVHKATGVNPDDADYFRISVKELPPFWTRIRPYENFQRGAYEKVCDFFKIDPWGFNIGIEHMRLSAFNLVSLFGRDSVSAIEFVIRSSNKTRDKITSNDMHNAGIGINFPKDGIEIEKWRHLLLKFPEAARYIGGFNDIEKKLGRLPTSLNELRNTYRLIGYGDYPEEYSDIAKQCVEKNIRSDTFHNMLNFFGKEKNDQMLPDASISTGGCKVSLLPPGDWRALVAGEFSSCCQSLGDAGKACAIHSYTRPESGIFWFESEESGKCMAQSWAWISEDKKTIVLDSIESELQEDEGIKRVSKAVGALVESLSNQGYDVLVGRTDYGITGDLIKLWGLGKESRMATPTMLYSCSYSDARGGCYALAKGVPMPALDDISKAVATMGSTNPDKVEIVENPIMKPGVNPMILFGRPNATSNIIELESIDSPDPFDFEGFFEP